MRILLSILACLAFCGCIVIINRDAPIYQRQIIMNGTNNSVHGDSVSPDLVHNMENSLVKATANAMITGNQIGANNGNGNAGVVLTKASANVTSNTVSK